MKNLFGGEGGGWEGNLNGKNIGWCVENSVRFKFKYIENRQTNNEVVPHINLPPQPVRLKGTGNKKKTCNLSCNIAEKRVE